MDLCVAGLPIAVESADKAFFARRFAEYVRQDDRPPVMTMRTRLLDVVPYPPGEPVQRHNRATVVRLADGRMCRFVCAPDERVLFAIYFTPDYADVEIQLLASRRHPMLTQTDWEYMYTGAMFYNRLMTLGGGMLHSSAIAWQGRGVAFSANSGTGKSTHTGLWKAVFGDAVEIINDDKPAISFAGEQPVLFGTPWSGKTALNHNMQAPLEAIVFIDRGQQNHIRRLSDSESFYRLTEQVSRPYYDAALGERAVDFVQRLMAVVPVYCLTCNISPEAAETAFRGIFPQEEMHR